MAAAVCIVCTEQPAITGESEEDSHVQGRLEKVLGDSVPESAALCASCRFDLNQIEMYYALLTAFRHRYWENAEKRKQIITAQASCTYRNVLQEKASSLGLDLLAARSEGNHESTNNSAAHPIQTAPDIKTEVIEVKPLEGSDNKDESVVEISKGVIVHSAAIVSDKALKTENADDDEHGNDILYSGVEEDDNGNSLTKEETRLAGVMRKAKPMSNKRPRGRPRKHAATVIMDTNKRRRGRPRKVQRVRDTHTQEEFPESEDFPLVIDEDTDINESQTSPAETLGKCRRIKPNQTGQVDDPEWAPEVPLADKPLRPSRARKRGRPRKNIMKMGNEESLREEEEELALVGSGRVAVMKRKRGRPRKNLTNDPESCTPRQSPLTKTKIEKSENAGENDANKKERPRCHVCNKDFQDNWKLKMHMVMHQQGDKAITCPVCSHEFRSVSAVRAHMVVHSGEKPYECDVCGKKMQRLRTLQIHVSQHSDIKSYKCDKCDKKFKNQLYLDYHVRKHHVVGRSCLCPVCGKSFFTMAVLKVHMRLHNDTREKQYQCQHCSSTFFTKGECTQHESTHKSKTDRRRYQCTECGKIFLQKTYLNYHMEVHRGTAKHKCTYCDEAFPTPSELRKHVMKHTGEKPYKCTECPKAFRISSNLYAHMRYHTGERPYVCSCGMAFHQSGTLKKHVRRTGHSQETVTAQGGLPSGNPATKQRPQQNSPQAASSSQSDDNITSLIPIPQQHPQIIQQHQQSQQQHLPPHHQHQQQQQQQQQQEVQTPAHQMPILPSVGHFPHHPPPPVGMHVTPYFGFPSGY